MSDYLNSLVTRTLRLAPVVQPRPASLFEPVAAASVDESAFAASETRATPELPSLDPRLPAQPSNTTVQQNEPGTVKEPSAVIDQPDLVRAPLLAPQPVRPPLLSVSEKESTREVRYESLPRQSAESNSTPPATETHKHSAPPVIRPDVKIFSPASDRDPVQPLLTTAPLPPITRSDPATRNANVIAQAAEPAEAPDTVVVTIGRVDVRAIFPPAQSAPRATRTQPQAMSLDEYLKQRSEGRR